MTTWAHSNPHPNLAPSEETSPLAHNNHQQHLYPNHPLGLQSQSLPRQIHSPHQHPAGANLSTRQMLAAQQHFGFAMQQQQQQQQQQPREGQTASTPSGGWNDDSELFLRNLLASNMESPPSSISGASYMATSPSYVNGGSSVDDNRHSLSPSSSSGFQSLHDFIHNNNFPTPPDSDTSGYNGHLSEGNPGKAGGMMAHPQQPQMSYPPHSAAMDPGALEYFVNSMVHNGEAGHSVNNSTNSGLDPSLVSSNYLSGTPPYSFQAPAYGSLPLSPQQYQQMQQMQQQQEMHPQQQQQQHPGLDGRKRSAPGLSTEEALAVPSSGPSSAPRSKKKVRRQNSFSQSTPSTSTPSKPPTPTYQQEQVHPTSYLLPRMEVGSNATALAAIERLKAKRRAEVEMRIKQEEAIASQPKKDSSRGGTGKGLEGGGTAEPAQRNQKKVAHNAIERRYRNNINDRITALRNAVPALRELRPKKPGGSRKGKAQEQDLVDGVPAATKLNKATILGKATEYICYLKGRETRLVSEVAGLRELVRSLEGGEELLDLWEGEMEKVVAEQEAKAKEAFALEDDSFDFGGEDDDEDDEEDEEEGGKVASRSSSQSSSRYLMGFFMGFSVLGGGAELMSEHAAAASSTSSGRVIGASHQLLKRGMAATNVKLAGLVDVPHHYDHLPSHVLAVEVMRGLALLACLAFIFWPLIGRFITGQRPDGKEQRQGVRESKLEDDRRRKEMLGALARTQPNAREMDSTMRKFVRAPGNALHGGAALVKLSGQELACRLGLMSRLKVKDEQAAVWCRLLELETSLGPLAQRSLLARLHTLFRVATLANVGYGSKSESVLLNPARVYGTMAIAMVRAARGNPVVWSLAERRWTMAKQCRLLINEQEEDEPTSEGKQDRWIDGVLEHSLADAIVLCPSPTTVASTFAPQVDSTTRASFLAPLPSIAAIQHRRQLTAVWNTMLCHIVKSTCPASQYGEVPTVSEFMQHHSDANIQLSAVANQEDQERLSSTITRLALAAPKYEHWQTLSNVTFGTWALLVGNISVARSVAAALLQAGEPSELPVSAVAFVKLVFGGSQAVDAVFARTSKKETSNEVDALAAASLTWLQFLKLLSASAKSEGERKEEVVVEMALTVRRLLASARTARGPGEEGPTDAGPAVDSGVSHRDSMSFSTSQHSSSSSSISEEAGSVAMRGQATHLDESLDTLTDILSLLGRKAALGTLGNWKHIDEQYDSGVEWGI